MTYPTGVVLCTDSFGECIVRKPSPTRTRVLVTAVVLGVLWIVRLSFFDRELASSDVAMAMSWWQCEDRSSHGQQEDDGFHSDSSS